MTYQFPETLPNLVANLKSAGVDVTAFKTERQAAFMIQQMLGTRFKFPPKGQSCFPLLQRLDAAVTGDISSQKTGFGRNPVLSSVIKSQVSTAVPPGLVIYCDGACEPNPGAGGWGFVVYRDGVEIHSDCGGADPATNNTMELTGALMALSWFAERGIVEPVRLLCDSQYVVRGCNEWRHGWKAKGWKRGGPKAKEKNSVIANLDLWQALDAALTLVPITLEWVKGHAGIIGNERADELSLEGREAVLELQPDPADLIEQQLAYSI